MDKKYIKAESVSEADKKQMIMWAKIIGCIGGFFVLAGLIVSLMGTSTAWTAYLNDIGFQAFIFFGVLVGCNAVWLYSNSIDTKKDPKALPINLNLFATTRGYTWGTLGICLITAILYICLW
jgi:SSS family solute:Na+ symporter